jgi:hypothetical protein
MVDQQPLNVLGNFRMKKPLPKSSFLVVLVCLLMLIVVFAGTCLIAGNPTHTDSDPDAAPFDSEIWKHDSLPQTFYSPRYKMREKALEQLEVGMSREQLVKILGEPTLTDSAIGTIPYRTDLFLGNPDSGPILSRIYYQLAKDHNSSDWTYYLAIELGEKGISYAYVGLN